MKVEGWLFIGCGLFLTGADIVYWYVSYDPTGTTALALAIGLCMLAGFYVLFTGRNISKQTGAERPEDNPEAEVYEGTGETRVLQPALLVAVVGWPGRGRHRGGPRDRVVACPARHRRRPLHVRRLRLRVLPRPLQPLSQGSAARPAW